MRQLKNVTQEILENKEFESYLEPYIKLMGIVGYDFSGISSIETEFMIIHTLVFRIEPNPPLPTLVYERVISYITSELTDESTDAHYYGDVYTEVIITIEASK